MKFALLILLAITGCKFSGEIETDLECTNTCDDDQATCHEECVTECADAGGDTDSACDTDCETVCDETHDECTLTCSGS